MSGSPAGLNRRSLLKAGGVSLLSGSGVVLRAQPGARADVLPSQLHLQFGADAARQMTVSWVTAGGVARPRLRLGAPHSGPQHVVEAQTRVYRDSRSGRETVIHHVPLSGLRPDSGYVYEVLHDGGAASGGSFRTAPAGRAPLRFTSFGDQGAGDGHLASSVWAEYLVDQVEAKNPLFHLLNGDLAYSNQAADRAAAWDAFFANNSRSARHRPWMPSVGNHENEFGNGELGFNAYRTRYSLPSNGSADYSGLWYSFKAGSVFVVSLDNNDACYQEAADLYLRGYSDGAQRQWLETTLHAARADPEVDWIVVSMHQLALSAALANGSDLGVREAWLDLFDRYDVDLVLAGHDHAYERSHLVRGFEADSPTRRPAVVSTEDGVLDATKGTVHLVVGTGGAPTIEGLYTFTNAGVPLHG
ncbi:MAG: purple acid phosphatase family protein [Haloechinothrix sp.]